MPTELKNSRNRNYVIKDRLSAKPLRFCRPVYKRKNIQSNAVIGEA